MIKSTGIDFFTFYATTGAEKFNHQLVVATTGAFTLTSVVLDPLYTRLVTPKCILSQTEDPDKMLDNVAFHQGLYCLLIQN